LLGDVRASLISAELLVRGGTSVVFTQPIYEGRPDRQVDTHNDGSGAMARQILAPTIPVLRTFVARVLAIPNRNVVIAVLGEFSRTMPKSDHALGGTATVIGRYVKAGTAGAQTADGSPPADAPPVDGLWSFLASALRVEQHSFGRNPHRELLV
jgi:hypothetical protein